MQAEFNDINPCPALGWNDKNYFTYSHSCKTPYSPRYLDTSLSTVQRRGSHSYHVSVHCVLLKSSESGSTCRVVHREISRSDVDATHPSMVSCNCISRQFVKEERKETHFAIRCVIYMPYKPSAADHDSKSFGRTNNPMTSQKQQLIKLKSIAAFHWLHVSPAVRPLQSQIEPQFNGLM